VQSRLLQSAHSGHPVNYDEQPFTTQKWSPGAVCMSILYIGRFYLLKVLRFVCTALAQTMKR
jgi:hypothetical protein